LNGWGLNVDPICLLCNVDQESRNHLFFECGYSASVWSQIAFRCDLQVTSSWGGYRCSASGLANQPRCSSARATSNSSSHLLALV
ncbi:unnamed protein product, partial [Brassica rapa subsp. narinosa]